MFLDFDFNDWKNCFVVFYDNVWFYLIFCLRCWIDVFFYCGFLWIFCCYSIMCFWFVCLDLEFWWVVCLFELGGCVLYAFFNFFFGTIFDYFDFCVCVMEFRNDGYGFFLFYFSILCMVNMYNALRFMGGVTWLIMV